MEELIHEDEIPVGRAEDLRGQKYNRLTVKYRVKNLGKQTAWLCICDCGNEVVVTGAHLKDGHTKSCGCLQKEKVAGKNRNNHAQLTGLRFGRLLVLKPTEERSNGDIVWECLCDCGNTHKVRTSSLTRGDTTSCGCYRSETASERYKQIGANRASDLIGQRFGKLTVVRKTDERKFGNIIWECVCDCGNICFVPTSYLNVGDTASCGCLASKGELKIQELLKENGISFVSQKTFADCVYPETKGKPRFDFYVDNKYIIEYDGIQHFKATNYGWNTEDNLVYTQNNDIYKNQYCKNQNIPLIRIPYTKLNTLCIEDLLLETTQFRVV